MDKFWAVLTFGAGYKPTNGGSASGTLFTTKEAAVDWAKRQAGAKGNSSSYEYVVLEAIQVAKAPVPAIEMVEIK